MFSLILFTTIYSILFILFIYLLNKKIQHGFEEIKTEDQNDHLNITNPILN